MKADLNQISGRVIAKKANYFIVEVDKKHIKKSALNDKNITNSFRVLCTLRRRLIYCGTSCYVGDRVFLESIDWQFKRAVIGDLAKRRNLFSRPQLANITDVFVFFSMKEPDFDFQQASNFLLAAEQSGVNVFLVINKIDLTSIEELRLKTQRLVDWGYEVYLVSVKTGLGIQKLLAQLSLSKVAVFSGPSGVGKSSLLKSILPNEIITIGELSGKLQRGRHTTRHVQLYKYLGDTLVADTPGFNKPDLAVDALDLQYLFPEIRSQLKESSCKFRDCLHCNEPGCIVEKTWERYKYYRKLVNELTSFRS